MSYVVRINRAYKKEVRRMGRDQVWTNNGWLTRHGEIAPLIGSAEVFQYREEAEAAAATLVLMKQEYLDLVEVRGYNPTLCQSYAL
jgi:hypothetical protein